MPPKRAAVYLRGEGERLRAAIYTRVSRDMRDTGRSVGEQEAECRTWVDYEGWELVGKQVWCDNDRSASQYATKAREDWQELLEQIEGGHIDILVVWEPARATRDRGVWAFLASLCEEQNVKIGASGRVYDLSDPEDAFQLDLFFALAARESRVARKRVNRGHRGNAAAGRPHGSALYGYRREYDNRTGLLLKQLPDEVVRTAFGRTCMVEHAFVPISTFVRAGIVREVARRVLDQEAFNSILRDLNMRGIPSPQFRRLGWHINGMRKMLLNPGYIGQRVFQGKIIGEADWGPILDTRTFYELTAKLTDPGRKRTRDGSVKHYLSGLLTCGVCGERMRMAHGGTEPLYACMRPRDTPGGKAFHTGRRQHRMYALIEGLVAIRLSQKDAEEVFVRDDSERDRLKELLKEASALRKRHLEHVDLAAKGELSALALARVEAHVLPELSRVETQMKAIRLGSLGVDLVRKTPEEVARAWRNLTVLQKREYVRALFKTITIHPIGRGAAQGDGSLLKGIDIEWVKPFDYVAATRPASAVDGGPVPLRRIERTVPSSGRVQYREVRLRLGIENVGKPLTVLVYDDSYRLLIDGVEVAYRLRSVDAEPR